MTFEILVMKWMDEYKDEWMNECMHACMINKRGRTELQTDFFTLEWPQKVCTEGGKINTKQKGIFDRKKATLFSSWSRKKLESYAEYYYYK